MNSLIKIIALSLTATAALSVPANAGSLSVGKKLEVNVNPKKMDEEKARLWKEFGGWCAIKDWHPAISACEESKEGDVQVRTLTLKDGGGTIKEKLIENVEGRYKYEIIESPLPVKNYQAQFALTPDDDDEDEINFAWSAVFDPADGKPPKEARGVIEGIFNAGLESIKAKTGGGKKDDDAKDDKKK